MVSSTQQSLWHKRVKCSTSLPRSNPEVTSSFNLLRVAHHGPYSGAVLRCRDPRFVHQSCRSHYMFSICNDDGRVLEPDVGGPRIFFLETSSFRRKCEFCRCCNLRFFRFTGDADTALKIARSAAREERGSSGECSQSVSLRSSGPWCPRCSAMQKW